MRFESNANREKFLMVRLLARLGDAEKHHNEFKRLRTFEQKGNEMISELSENNANLRRKVKRLSRKLEENNIEIESKNDNYLAVFINENQSN